MRLLDFGRGECPRDNRYPGRARKADDVVSRIRRDDEFRPGIERPFEVASGTDRTRAHGNAVRAGGSLQFLDDAFGAFRVHGDLDGLEPAACRRLDAGFFFATGNVAQYAYNGHVFQKFDKIHGWPPLF